VYITGDPEGIPYSVFTEKLPHSRTWLDDPQNVKINMNSQNNSAFIIAYMAYKSIFYKYI
jgi:hypothetical protein